MYKPRAPIDDATGSDSIGCPLVSIHLSVIKYYTTARDTLARFPVRIDAPLRGAFASATVIPPSDSFALTRLPFVLAEAATVVVVDVLSVIICLMQCQSITADERIVDQYAMLGGTTLSELASWVSPTSKGGHAYLPLSQNTAQEDEAKLRSTQVRRRCQWLQKYETFLLAVILSSTMGMCLYFRCPSTLFLYLSLFFLALPIDIVRLSYIANRNRSSPPSFGRQIRFLALASGLVVWMWCGVGFLSDSVFHDQTFVTRPFTKLTSEKVPMSVASDLGQGPVFIAANLYNSAHLFPRFKDNLLRLIESIGGPDTVYVSIFESNSIDDGATSGALQDLERQLAAQNVSSTIITGTADPVKMQRHLGIEDDGHRRIQFLAGVRNTALKPLSGASAHLGGRPFAKVLWLNDIVFDPDEVVSLLATNGGAYDAACAFDYMPLGLYDTWVTRDVYGDRAKPLWPYFAAGSDVDALIDRRPVLVNSCWNGAVAFDARWFTDDSPPRTSPILQHPSAKERQRPTSPSARRSDTAVRLPLRFRSSSLCLSSECLLTSLDIHRALQPVRPVILMNPNVVTAYDHRTFFLYHDLMRWSIVRPWHVVWERLLSARLFRSITDIGRKPAVCRDRFEASWVRPPNSKNSLRIDDVARRRWSREPSTYDDQAHAIVGPAQ